MTCHILNQRWPTSLRHIQYIPINMHTVFALLCFVVVIHWLIFPYPSGLLHWHWGNLTIAPVPAKQPWWIWINTSCEFIMNDCKPQQSKAQRNRVHISWDILYMCYSNPMNLCEHCLVVLFVYLFCADVSSSQGKYVIKLLHPSWCFLRTDTIMG